MALAPAVVGAVEAVGGYAGGVYLRSRTKGLLRLAVLAGLPVRLFRPWWRMHVNRPFPVAEAFRSGEPVHLADAEEAMRRFPQLMAGLPFPFGSLYVPVSHGTDRYGVLVVLRTATPGRPVDPADRQRLRSTGDRLGAALAELERTGTPVSWERSPAPVQLPAGAPRPSASDGSPGRRTPAPSPPTPRRPASSAARPATRPPPSESWRNCSRPKTCTACGHWPAASPSAPTPTGPPRAACGSAAATAAAPPRTGPPPRWRPARLTGLLVDPGTGPIVAAAAEPPRHRRALPRPRHGRITYASRSAETLLGVARPALVGRILWDVLPWTGRPAYEDQFGPRSIASDPVHFLAHRDSATWLSVSLHPDHDGLTVTLSAAEEPTYAPASVAAPGGDSARPPTAPPCSTGPSPWPSPSPRPSPPARSRRSSPRSCCPPSAAASSPSTC